MTSTFSRTRRRRSESQDEIDEAAPRSVPRCPIFTFARAKVCSASFALFLRDSASGYLKANASSGPSYSSFARSPPCHQPEDHLWRKHTGARPWPRAPVEPVIERLHKRLKSPVEFVELLSNTVPLVRTSYRRASTRRTSCLSGPALELGTRAEIPPTLISSPFGAQWLPEVEPASTRSGGI